MRSVAKVNLEIEKLFIQKIKNSGKQYKSRISFLRKLHEETFGYQCPVQSFTEWIVQNLSVNNEHPLDKGASTNTKSTENSTSSNSTKQKRERWPDSQTKTLVNQWKQYFQELENSKQHSAWIKIKYAVNKKGPAKTLRQIKDKIRNLKDAYKRR